MALTHAIDTSAITRLRHPIVRGIVEPMAASQSLAVSRLAALELGYCARHAEEWDRIQLAIQQMRVLDAHEDDARQALLVQRELASRGLRGRKIVDLLVAAMALRLGLTVLHYDHDFDHIASVTGQAVAWVVPAGTVD